MAAQLPGPCQRGDDAALAPLAAAALAAFLVGAAMVATRFVIEQTTPATLALFRYAIGVAILLPVALARGPIRVARGDLLPVAVLGIGQFGILIALLNFGLQSVPASRASVLFTAFPLLTVIIAALIGLERFSALKAAGAALTMAGVGLALLDRIALADAGSGGIGEAAVLASALVGALCAVYYRPYLRRYAVLPVSVIAMAASVLFLALLAAGEGLFTAPPRIDAPGWAAIAFIGLASALGYWLWLWALGRTSPTRVTSWIALSPITASVLGALLLGEPLGTTFLLGLACVALGIWLAHRPA